jgi:hypothetical protein
MMPSTASTVESSGMLQTDDHPGAMRHDSCHQGTTF